MSQMKRYAEEVSGEMGFGGELTDEVLIEAQRRLDGEAVACEVVSESRRGCSAKRTTSQSPAPSTRTPRADALPVAQHFAAELAAIPGVTRVEIAGSLRRHKATVGDIDIVCESDNGAAVIQAFCRLAGILDVGCAGKTKCRVAVAGGMNIDLRVVAHESFGALLQHATGSWRHNVELRKDAKARGWKLNEYGLFDGARRIAGENEADVYAMLGRAWVAPEDRN